MPDPPEATSREATRAIQEARRLRKALEVAKRALGQYASTAGKNVAREALAEIERKEKGG